MLLRQAVWQVGERVGDGAATTAVLVQAMARHAFQSAAAGANTMRIRDGIRLGVDAAVQALLAQSKPVVTRKELQQIARSFCHHEELAQLLGEIYTVVGAGGYVDVQSSNGRQLEREYVEGAFWRNTGWLSSAFADKSLRRSSLQDAAVILVNGRIGNVEALARVMGMTMNAGYKSIAIICNALNEIVLNVLAHNHEKGTFQCLPIRTPASSVERKFMFDDLAVMTGGKVIAGGEDADLSYFAPDMLGKVRRIWADAEQYGLVAGKGSPQALRAHIKTLRASLANAKDKDEINSLRKRLGRLMGGTAMINVGAPTEIEQKVLKNVAERSVRFMNSVTESGTIPGGGAAYLNCKAAVDNLATTDPDVYAGVRAVSRALDEPMRAIAANAGFPESATVARACQKGAGYGLNVLTGEIVEMRAEGIVDSARVAEHALRVAASVTTMLLTTDVVVRRRNPETASEP